MRKNESVLRSTKSLSIACKVNDSRRFSPEAAEVEFDVSVANLLAENFRLNGQLLSNVAAHLFA